MRNDIEEQIRRAMEDGQFDHLPGKGKPLQLDENPYEDPGWRLAHHLLRNNGFSLPWIERRREIETELDSARSSLRQAFANWQEGKAPQVPAIRLNEEWHRAVESFRQRITDLNKHILNNNLEAPSLHFHLRPLNPDRELELTIATASDTLQDANPE